MTKGFTLLETVIALAILGVASGSIITIFSESLYRIRHSERVMQANALAQSLLARVEVGEISLQANSTPMGEADGGFSWKIEALPYGAAEDRSAWVMQPQKVAIAVSWDDKKENDTTTLSALVLIPKSVE